MPFPIDDLSRRYAHEFFAKREPTYRWTEKFFLDVLERTNHRFAAVNAIVALRDCGTLRAVPTLKRMVHFPVRDVKSTALLTVAHIAKQRESHFYRDCLRSPAYPEKGYALWALDDAGDCSGVPDVLEYFKKNGNKLDAGALSYASMWHGASYLLRCGRKDTSVFDCITMIANGVKKLDPHFRTIVFRHLPELKLWAKPANHALQGTRQKRRAPERGR